MPVLSSPAPHRRLFVQVVRSGMDVLRVRARLPNRARGATGRAGRQTRETGMEACPPVAKDEESMTVRILVGDALATALE